MAASRRDAGPLRQTLTFGARKSMKSSTPCISIILCFTLTMLSVSPAFAAKPKEVGVAFPMKYEGGSLPLNQHSSLTTYVGKDEIVILQDKQRIVVSVKSINEVSYGNDVH